MNRKYYNYKLWEDYKNGMYEKGVNEKLVEECVLLLCNKKHFYENGKLMLKTWIYSSEQNLTNNDINQKAWIGQATCNFRFKANIDTVIEAWHKLTQEQQKEANYLAFELIKEYKNNKKNILCPKLNLE
jgi:hypothetical protein